MQCVTGFEFGRNRDLGETGNKQKVTMTPHGAQVSLNVRCDDAYITSTDVLIDMPLNGPVRIAQLNNRQWPTASSGETQRRCEHPQQAH